MRNIPRPVIPIWIFSFLRRNQILYFQVKEGIFNTCYSANANHKNEISERSTQERSQWCGYLYLPTSCRLTISKDNISSLKRDLCEPYWRARSKNKGLSR